MSTNDPYGSTDDRRALHVSELSAEHIEAIAQAEAPPEAHAYDYED
jgi:hypothetical protein